MGDPHGPWQDYGERGLGRYDHTVRESYGTYDSYDAYETYDNGYGTYELDDDEGPPRHGAGRGGGLGTALQGAAGDVAWRYRSAPLWARVTVDFTAALAALGLIFGVALALHSDGDADRAGATATTTTTVTTVPPTTAPVTAPPTTPAPTTTTTRPATTTTAAPTTTTPPTTSRPTDPPRPTPPSTEPGPDGPSFRNCFEAFRAGAIPLLAGDPGYSRRLDDDGDGVACEFGEGM
jgi:Excalibur calcium-binding domain